MKIDWRFLGPQCLKSSAAALVFAVLIHVTSSVHFLVAAAVLLVAWPVTDFLIEAIASKNPSAAQRVIVRSWSPVAAKCALVLLGAVALWYWVALPFMTAFAYALLALASIAQTFRRPEHDSRHPRRKIMSNNRPSLVAPWCLIIGALLGLAGSFAPSASLRGLAWGIDGTALIVGAAVLTVHFIRRGQDLLAAGFVVFIAGEALVVSGSAMSLEASGPSFAAGAALWAAALVLISTPNVMPLLARVLGFIAALLFAGVALQVFAGRSLTPLSEPLPFFAYPFLVFTLFGWAWWCVRAPPQT